MVEGRIQGKDQKEDKVRGGAPTNQTKVSLKTGAFKEIISNEFCANEGR